MTTTGAAAVLAGLCVAVGAALVRMSPGTRRLQVALGRPTRGAMDGHGVWRRGSAAPIGAAAAGLLLAGAYASPLPACAGAVGAVVLHRRARRAAGEREAAERRAEVAVLVDGLRAALSAGREPGPALSGALGDCPGLREDAERTPPDADAALPWAMTADEVLDRLHEAAASPGGEGLRQLAVCWRVARDSGAGLGAALDRVATSLRSDRERRTALAAELAGCRATIRLLGALPLVAVLMGPALGSDPVRTLTHTRFGVACLVLGAALDAAGFLWADRIVRATAEAR